tara:strand:- start:990 stop:1130 length:141 start_codon:yes stop_codon:yes gene_type:complete
MPNAGEGRAVPAQIKTPLQQVLNIEGKLRGILDKENKIHIKSILRL